MKGILIDSDLNYEAKVIGNVFVKGALKGFDSDDFCYKFLTSDYGSSILQEKRLNEYACDNFMLEGLINNLDFKKGYSYDEDILYYAGYLYKYWISSRNVTSKEVYKLAPIKLIADRFGFYHTQGWDYVINDIIERPYKED